ncbi:MAG: DUF3999 family protein [Sedimenticola sp.]
MIKIVGLMGLVLISTLTQAEDYQTGLEDYAYQAELSELEGSLLRVNLLAELLVVLARDDLGDVAVFDHRGERMPTWVQPRQHKNIRQSIPLTFYEFTSGRGGDREERVKLSRDSQGRVEGYNKLSGPQSVVEVVSHYVIELPQDDRSIRIDELRLDWTQQPEQRLLTVQLHASDDLNHWTLLSANISLTHLMKSTVQPDGRGIRVDTSKKYLRLSLNEPPDRFRIRSVVGYYKSAQPKDIRWIATGALVAEESDPGYFAFSVAPKVRPEGVRFTFSKPNQLVKGALYSLNQKRGERILRQRAVVQHNITGNSDVAANKSITLQGVRDSQWWFKPEQAMAESPVVEIAMPQYELLFLAGGEAPYRIVWGNRDAPRPTNKLKAVIDRDRRSTIDLPLVVMRATTPLGGEERVLQSKAESWLKWLLWASLMVVIVVAGRMAYQLYREMAGR